MRVGFVQWPDNLLPQSEIWEQLASDVARSAPDILVTNEMPFGPWLARSSIYSPEGASNSIEIHGHGLIVLRALQVPIVISSRPVKAGDRLANEAFILDRDGYRRLHQKHFFPSERGWHESEWFKPDLRGFEALDVGGLKVGALLCTELMFNERARAYGRAGAHLIAVPRASGSSLAPWRTAAAMAALVSGCYVVSSNRVGSSMDGPAFGGDAYAFGPDGSEISSSIPGRSIEVFELDREAAEQQKKCYPVYVGEEA